MSATKYHHHHTIEAALRSQPKERPIIFSADMVRAILEGRKTQTRRIMDRKSADWIRTLSSPEVVRILQNGMSERFGYPGDTLWVRETWRWFDAMAESDQDGVYSGYQYRADVPREHDDSIVWRPSIHMPRAACRLLLEITDVRVEQLQDINRADAIAEGLHFTISNGGPNIYYDNYHTGRWLDPEMLNNPIASFRTLWEKINGPGSWEANPWVWVISFKKIG